MHLVLASESPQRRHILQGLGWDFLVEPSAIDESACMQKDPAIRAQTLARLKAAPVAARHPEAVVIGCDTLVVSADGTLLEKPTDAQDARRMLRLLSGKTCIVHSGLCVMRGLAFREGLSTSSVTFVPLTAERMDWWIGTGLWRGRSGSFQIDGLGQLMIERIEGDWTSVVGLPVFLLGTLLGDFGYGPFDRQSSESR